MMRIDGSIGEGGGQILRTSLTLSLLTGAPFHLEKIRAGRNKPGLMRQHLTAVNAAIAIGNADVDGADVGSSDLTFRPRSIQAGDYTFSIGSAGSTTLVLQTILLPLLAASSPSTIRLEGGTHNPFAPPYDFLSLTFLPLLRRMGAKVEVHLERPGFYPAGGGRLIVTIQPSTKLQPIELMERGEIKRTRARAIVANLPRSIAARELGVVERRLGWSASGLEVEAIEDGRGPGNVLILEIESDRLVEVFSGFGERNVTAETVARGATEEARKYLASNAPVGRHLADQLLIPLALARAGGFRTVTPTPHTTTNIDVIQRFTDVKFQVASHSRDDVRVTL